MDLRVQKRTMEWLYYLFTQKNEEAARIPFTPSKRVLAQDFPESTRLERAVPEQEGVSSALFANLLEWAQTGSGYACAYLHDPAARKGHQ